MRLPDLWAARRANKRMMKLSKKLKQTPRDRDLQAELWLRCDEFKTHLTSAYGISMPDQAEQDLSDARALADAIEKELGRAEIADRIEDLDPLRARALRNRS